METYFGYIESTNDCLLIFEACRLGILKCVQRRLSDDERVQISSGSIFVWDEEDSGIKRWTDGKSWSPSRVNGCFLSYHELDGKKSLSSRDRSDSYDLSGSSPTPQNKVGSYDVDSSQWDDSSYSNSSSFKKTGLIKKALSVFTSFGNKLHLICYYRKEDVSNSKLVPPSADPRLKDISIPRGMYPEMVPELIHPMVGFIPNSLSDPRSRSCSFSRSLKKKFEKSSPSANQCAIESNTKYIPYNYPKTYTSELRDDFWNNEPSLKRKFQHDQHSLTSQNHISNRNRSKRAYSSSYKLPPLNEINLHLSDSCTRPRLQTLASIAIVDSLNPIVYSASPQYRISPEDQDYNSNVHINSLNRSSFRSNSISVTDNKSLSPISVSDSESTNKPSLLPITCVDSKTVSRPDKIPSKIFDIKTKPKHTHYFQSREDKRQLAALRSTMFKI
ncbi:cAMP-independent regulatory protein pac2 [Smittium mucronatum]|uniref:cAMP-independent regulatory protein pac2 n=1 Tax=Smittium mucronatum TaxID=133383 RepID=A0A1R0GXX4_9FUNG|nr:cAMP-independent regulatory protein pac2 [Smittium mucronatum]